MKYDNQYFGGDSNYLPHENNIFFEKLISYVPFFGTWFYDFKYKIYRNSIEKNYLFFEKIRNFTNNYYFKTFLPKNIINRVLKIEI